MLGVLFVFTVYRAIDLCLDFYYSAYLVRDDLFTTIFVLGAAFDMWYNFHAVSVCCSHRQADPNFHPVEGIVNLAQLLLLLFFRHPMSAMAASVPLISIMYFVVAAALFSRLFASKRTSGVTIEKRKCVI